MDKKYAALYLCHNFIASLNPRWRWRGSRVLRAASEAAAVRRSVKCGNDEQSQTSVGERQRANTDLAHSISQAASKPIPCSQWIKPNKIDTTSL